MTLVVLPLVIPLVGAIAALVTGARAGRRALLVAIAVLHLSAALALLAVATVDGPQRLGVGSWPAPLGIALRVDVLSALMLSVTGLVAVAGALYAAFDDDPRLSHRSFAPAYASLLLGVSGAFVTADLFNLFVFFEVMLMSSFVLMTIGATRAQMRGGVYYVVANLVSSAFFLMGVGLVYGVAQTLDMADLSVRLAQVAAQQPSLVLAIGALLGVAFGIKAAVFPLFSWLPASYPAPPTPVSAVFAGLLTKVGIYAMIRVFGQVFPPMPVFGEVLLYVGAVTMIAGVAAAVLQSEIRRILSFHVVSQVGYIVAAAGLMSSSDPAVRELGVAAAIFYSVHHIIVKTNLFLIAGIVHRMGGSTRLARLGGLAACSPLLAAVFLVAALSLAGVPPLSGFWAKLVAFRAAIDGEVWLVVGAAAAAGILTLASMVKIWNGALWRPAPAEAILRRPGAGLLLPAVLLAAVTVSLGLAPEGLFELSGRAAVEIFAGGSP